jgi:hypothetical protein
MQSTLGKELRKQFALKLSRTFPGFVEVKVNSVWPGARMYVHRTPQTSYFIRLVPIHNADEFRIMYGWSSSGEPPTEVLHGRPERDRDFLSHDGYEFRVRQIINEAGATGDKMWILDDEARLVLNRPMVEFAKPGDTEIQTLQRQVSETFRAGMSLYHQIPVEKLLPNIPMLIDDCLQCLAQTVMPYFQQIKELKSQNTK